MKTMYADPEKLESIFSDRYLIPMYQRKYTWEEEKCHRLWEDLLNFYEVWSKSERKNDKYFLGTITVWRSSDDEPWEVIDGQQRLITLSLLIKTFLNINEKNRKLLKCLHLTNPANDEVSPDNELRVASESIEENNNDFINIIKSTPGNEDYNAKSQMGKNYKILNKNVSTWASLEDGEKDGHIDLMLRMLTQNVQILRIRGENMDDALNIFETINDRGKPLDDSDILKVQLYRNVIDEDSDQKDFNIRWNALPEPKDYFTIYMHSLKASMGVVDTSSQSPRKFFLDYDRKNNLFKDWEKVMQELEKIRDITDGNWDIPTSLSNWWKILSVSHPGRGNRTAHWRLPLYVYLCANIHKRDDSGMLIVEQEVQEEFKKLIIMTVKFLVIKGINYKNSGVIRRPAYNICAAIAGKHKEDKYNRGNYLSVYTDELEASNDIKKFDDSIKDHKEFKSYWKLLVFLGSYLTEKQSQDADAFSTLLDGKIEIEYILPKNWMHYENWEKDSNWTEETHAMDINRLGNVMPLEYRLNKEAYSHSFKNKKEAYGKSKLQDAIDISICDSDIWTPETLANRDTEIKDRIINFIKED